MDPILIRFWDIRAYSEIFVESAGRLSEDGGMPGSMTRRKFVRTMAFGASMASMASVTNKPWNAWRFFTDHEAALVEAVTEQIIPADQDPGARDAGVVNFIDKQLAIGYRRHQPAYRAGLQALEATCQAQFGASFLALSWNQQMEILKLLESGKASRTIWSKTSSAAFFNLIRDHAMQGFYGGPQHGGNRGYASYKMLGIDYPQMIGQNRYRQPYAS